MIQKLLFSCPRLGNVYRGVDPLVHESAIQVDLHVSGALELFKDHLIHLAARIDQSGSNNRQTSTLLQISGCTEKSLGFMQCVSIHTSGKNLSAMGLHRVIGSRQTRDAIQQDHNICALLGQSLCPLNHHFRNVYVSIGWLIKGRTNHLALDGSCHIRNLLRPLINQKHDQMRLGIIGCDGIGNFLHQNRLSCPRRRNDQTPLTETNRADQIKSPHGHIF